METDRDARIKALLDAARQVEHWYYERDALWVKINRDELQEADAAVIALHNALVGLGESKVVEDR